MTVQILTDFEIPAAKLPYADEIAALVEATKEHGAKAVAALELPYKKNEDNVWVVTLTEQAKLQAAARAAGYSARMVAEREDKGKGIATRWFKLAPKTERKTGEKGEESATVDSDAAAS